MKHFKKMAITAIATMTLVACRESNNEENSTLTKNNVTLQFNNVVGNQPLVLGKAYTSNNQSITFGEVKYVISNIYLVKTDGTEVSYNVDNLDTGATVVNLAKTETLNYTLTDIPAGTYKQIKLGIGVKQELNKLDAEKFPKFYTAAGANDTQLHWEWASGYRFTKIEGSYGTSNASVSIHTGSTVKGTKNDPTTWVPGVDAFRQVTLSLPTNAIVGNNAPKITINADFDKLLNGTNKITLSGNIPIVHNPNSMIPIVDNLGGNGTTNITGMFSVSKVE